MKVDLAALERALDNPEISDDELRELAAQVQQAQGADRGEGPQTRDELHAYIRETYGINVPRVAVCPGHKAPFDFVADAFFEVVTSLFGMGARSSGKSFLVALIHHLNSRFKRGCESATFGAVGDQAKRVYNSFKSFLNKGLEEGEIETVGDPMQSETLLKNGSKVEVFTATVAKVNGPHPQKAHSDEVEIMRAAAWKESRNLATDKVVDGVRIRAQNIATSTRKWKNGRVDKLFQGFLDSVKRGVRPQFHFYVWCIFEVAEEVPSCRMVRGEEREARLKELGRDPCETCSCNTIESDTWEDGQRRTLDQVCRGRFFRSRGYRSHEEVIETFMQNDRRTWEAQQECSEAESEGLYVECFSRSRHGIKRFYLDPANGPIYTGTDYGTTAYHATLWVQLLHRPVTVQSYSDGSPRTLPKGARVLFGMYYEPGRSDTENGKAVVEREKQYAKRTGRTELRVRKRWADLQAASGRKDWRNLGLETEKYDRDFATHVKEVERLFRKDLYFVVVEECVDFCEEIEGWRKDEAGNEVPTLNHAMAANRYLCQGMHEELGREGFDDSEGELEEVQASTGPDAEEYSDDDLDDPGFDSEWRERLGAPAGVR